MPDTAVWEDIRRDYANQQLTIKDITTHYDISAHQLRTLVVDNDWPRRPSAVEAAKARKLAREAAELIAPADEPPPPPAEARQPVDRPAKQPAKRKTPASRKTPTKRKSTPIAHRRDLVRRLYAAIDTKLQLLERRFAHEMTATSGKSASAADTERDTRAIGLLIKNLEQVTEYDHGHEFEQTLRGAAAKSASVAATELADEADRLRREFGERLRRLAESPE